MKFFSVAFLFIALCYTFSACKKDNPPAEVEDELATNQTVFMSDFDGGLYAFNAQTGEALWEKHVDNAVRDGFVVTNKLGYVPKHDGSIEAYDINTGEMKWQVKLESSSYPNNLIVIDATLCTRASNHLIGLDAATGQRKWRIDSFSGGMLYSKDGILYWETGPELVAIEASSGTVKWRLAHEKYPQIPYWMDETLYGYAKESERDPSSHQYPFKIHPFVISFDLKKGTLALNQRIPDKYYPGQLFAASPDRLFISYGATAPGRLSSWSKKGMKLLWDVPMKLAFGFAAPFYSKSYLYTGNEEGILYRISEKSGEFQELCRFEGRIRSSPVVANGVIYVGSGESKTAIEQLHAVDESTGKIKWSIHIKGWIARVAPIVLDSNGKMHYHSASAMPK
ncbi:PQQ-binding-like beta-propeller repeat protein [Siphonobacter sp.]|uniref:outer membrane protein assembly factor BamB family protein n=1 Tax=Siphonobacter sp. TaxID=1869184 RepID=UPI003B3BAD0E